MRRGYPDAFYICIYIIFEACRFSRQQKITTPLYKTRTIIDAKRDDSIVRPDHDRTSTGTDWREKDEKMERQNKVEMDNIISKQAKRHVEAVNFLKSVHAGRCARE